MPQPQVALHSFRVLFLLGGEGGQLSLPSRRLAEQRLLFLPAAWLMERLFLSPSHSRPPPPFSCRTTLAVPVGLSTEPAAEAGQLAWLPPTTNPSDPHL